MRTETTTRNVYKFDELSDDQKQTVFENWRMFDTNDFWDDCVLDDAKTIAALMGIDIENIYYSGFSCQGDGACFTGSYGYEKGSVKAVKDYAPVDKKLHEITQTLCDLQKPYFYSLTAIVKHSGHYYHKYCTDVSCYVQHEINGYQYDDDASAEVHAAIGEVLRDFMQWIYDQLETTYWHTQSDEYIADTIEANDYEFYADGSIV